jgi:MFS family permease
MDNHPASLLSDKERKRGRILAYKSAWFACISEVMYDQSAIIIIYLTLLGSSETLTMFTTSLSSLASMFLYMFFAVFVDKIGLKKSAVMACFLGCAGFSIIAGAAFCSSTLAPYIVLLGGIAYSISRVFYGVTWYPLIDMFLLPNERAGFFGFMRSSYLILSTVLFFLLGLVMGKNPPIWLLQIIIAITGFLILGRAYNMVKFPGQVAQKQKIDFVKAFKISITNGPLISYSIYVCCVSAAYSSILPVSIMNMKNYFNLPANTVQLVSSIYLIGSITGFIAFKHLIKFLGIRNLQIAIHLMFIFIPLALFFITKESSFLVAKMTILLFLCQFCHSCYLCCFSLEMMSVARPGNKTMATAVCSTYNSIGGAVGRIVTSIALGCGAFAQVWTYKGVEYSRFSSLYAIYAFVAAFFLILVVSIPSVVPKHHDYYNPGN